MKIIYKIFSFLMLLAFMGCQKMERPVMNIIPDPADDGTIRVLAIGNSFSEDALETHLYDLAKANGQKIIIGNLYIGGATLAQHVTNIKANANAYSFRKIDAEGTKTTVANTSIATALASENWTHISFQQESSNSGKFDTWSASLAELYNYVAPRAKNENVKFLLHQTWAYAKNSTHSGFDNYNKDQMQMYTAIVDAVNKAKELVKIDLIIPAGTAIQNGRTSVVEDNFTRDGYHLSMPLGRYLAACTWYEAITGTNVVGNTYKPTGLSDFEIGIAQNAAHFAVQKPNEVTTMTDFQGGTGGPLTSSVLLDFGNNVASNNWNQINSFLAGTSINLKDSIGSYVGIKLTITERFNGINADGPTTTTTPLNMPSNVSKYSYFGNSKGAFSGMTIVQSKFELSGLDKNLNYDISFFGARGNVSDNRETKYVCKGTNEVIVRLNTSSNTNKIVVAKDIKPDANGKITVTVTSGENNTNGTGFYYLSAARLISK
ncbi:DUF4886 domain-containing protein [Sphingobacterium bovistauri]|uniref:DUF4886 domain-containing protein n=1 Tax=Sphingobacterium bovistauri TaxID=2781959 RepID=A0ABS7Z051_9SPHI|nr:DUF4886 domain-containing protein [Sphingobacterium bovistauri]MCA5003544.1 DUF4886 domain-containing protein [Sphingobacterium bovistauri]